MDSDKAIQALKNIIAGMEEEKQLIIQDTIYLLRYIDTLKDTIKKKSKLWCFKDPDLNFCYYNTGDKYGILMRKGKK